MDNISIIVGKNLYKARKAQDLSLDRLSEITGVSKSMLGQIERGEVNPTVNILWKIANGMRIPFSALMTEENNKVNVVRKKNITPVTGDKGEYSLYSLFPYNESKRFEIYSETIEPRGGNESDAHSKGVEEYVIVSKGILNMIINGEEFVIEEGDSISFRADVPHTYKNNTDEAVTIHTVLYYSL